MDTDPPGERHLTLEQREDISAGLEDSISGPVSMSAPASDKEAVVYQKEIANVLADMGCAVEIVNVKPKASVQEIPAGVEMTIKEETVRPIHAPRIAQVFRRAGVMIATRINARRPKNDTLYITVGRSDVPAPVLNVPRWHWKSLAKLFARRN